MAVRKRDGKKGASWQIDYLDPNGRRVRLSFKKKKDAEAELGKRVSLIAENRYLDVKKGYTTTLDELVEKYVENFKHMRSYRTSKSYYLENFKNYFGEATLLSNIGYVDVETYQNKLRTKLTPKSKARTTGAINREISCLRHLLRKAVSWNLMDKSPFAGGDSLLLKENNMRKRFLTEDEVDRLLGELKHKPHLYRIVFCALNTGMRRGEILSLKWDQVRNGFIYITESKTDERREIPVNDDVATMFKEIRREQELSSPYVFLYAGRKIDRVEVGFHAALKRAGIMDFRFHDLRHTFASHLVMRGASLKEVQELLGHKDIKMTMRYAHLAQENKKIAVNLLNGFANVTKVSQIQNQHSNPLLSLAKF